MELPTRVRMRNLLLRSIASTHLALHSSEYLLNWIHLWSILWNCDSYNSFLQEELVNWFCEMNGCIVKDEEKFGLELIIVVLVLFVKSFFKLNHEVEILKITIHSNSELGMQNSIIS